MLPKLAQGDANKVFVIPSEFSEAFGGISRAFAGRNAADEPHAADEDARPTEPQPPAPPQLAPRNSGPAD